MKLWWDLLSPDGYGYSWGRSLGAISYMDTMEIAAFLGIHPEFRPAPLPQFASAYFAAWSWLRSDFNDQTHLLSKDSKATRMAVLYPDHSGREGSA